MTLRTTFVLVALAVLTIAPVASAGDTVLLRDGRGGSAEILETTPDSVTLQFLLEGNEVKIKLGAAQLDPHNFYTLRSKYMERTAENHLRLCAFCIENSLFAQARHEWDRAKELNPELSEEVARTPEVRQGIAKRMLENARKLFAAKELEEAEKAASSLVTHFPETPAAEQAQALLEEVNGSIQARETKTREEAEAKWKKSEEKDFESKKKSVAPIYQSWETAKKMRAQGLRTKGHSASKNALVAAGQQFEKALARVASVRKSQAKDAEVIAHLDEIEPEIREDAVGAYVDAGSVLVARGSYKTASELARRALAIDPNSSHARSFQQRVEVAAAMASRSWR